jgi:hypothetical protein
LPIRYCRFRFPSFAESILKDFADLLLPVSFSELCQIQFLMRKPPVRLGGPVMRLYVKIVIVSFCYGAIEFIPA